MKDNPFDSEEADAILGGNVAICEHFATKSEEGDALAFPTEHTKSVKQTVRANLNYYKNINQFIKDEQSDTYSKIYVVIQKKWENTSPAPQRTFSKTYTVRNTIRSLPPRLLSLARRRRKTARGRTPNKTPSDDQR